MRRALILLPFLLSAAALAQPAPGAPLAPFGTDAALAAFGQDITAWQARINADFARGRAQQHLVYEAKARLRCDSTVALVVFPGVITPTPERAAVVAGQVVELWDGSALPYATVSFSDALTLQPDADGRFVLPVGASDLPSVRTVSASRPGYGTTAAPLALSPGDSVAVRLPLCVGQSPAARGVAQTVALMGGVVSMESNASITNVQTAGVDEGGIVKRHGDVLVILRRGRLFTVDVSGRRPRPVAAIDAFAPGMDPRRIWIDEMLIAGETVVVLGYNYRTEATEITLFSLGDAGALAYQSTYHLRSDDYYASRNYAARLVGGRLVFYAPLDASAEAWSAGVEGVLPALSRWDGGQDGRFVPIATATRVYRPARALTSPNDVALHTVTSCAVARGELDCEATAVVGPFDHTFYASAEAVYVWLADRGAGQDGRPPAVLYRMPVDGSAPRALGVQGSPTDQFSFLEADGSLNVLVAADSRGQWMWHSEGNHRGLALLHVALSDFGDGSRNAPADAYRVLPEAGYGDLTNRFVGGHLLYGRDDPYGYGPRGDETEATQAVVVDWRTGAVDSVAVPHGIERIEAMGDGAVAVGSAADGLHLTALRLGAAPAIAGAYVMPGAEQGESRSHGFFYRPTGDATDGSMGGEAGMLGLPVREAGDTRYASLREGSASVLFLENRAGALRRLGNLAAHPNRDADDNCRASCVDWYGNARPLFLGDRVFALMGYELVEGAVRRGRLREVRRVSFAPMQRPARP